MTTRDGNLGQTKLVRRGNRGVDAGEKSACPLRVRKEGGVPDPEESKIGGKEQHTEQNHKRQSP